MRLTVWKYPDMHTAYYITITKELQVFLFCYAISPGNPFTHTLFCCILVIVRYVKKERHLEIVVSREDTCLIEDNDPAFVNHIIHVLKNRTEIIPDITQIQGPVIKIAVACMSAGPELMDRYLRGLKDKFGAEIKVVTSGNIWIDFIAPDANKGTALSALLNTLHIRPEEYMAFGDQYNDVEMLELAGTSYAMSGAAPGISRYASHVTDSVEDVLEDLLGRLT